MKHLTLHEEFVSRIEEKKPHMFADYPRAEARKDLARKDDLVPKKGIRWQFEKDLNVVINSYKRRLGAEEIHDTLEIVYQQSKNNF